ncbi:hypothetical protein GW17_00005227 [Ensete ventricosum]|nr:hypothetical protein GW17_00005227 [Ensete ventricosum]
MSLLRVPVDPLEWQISQDMANTIVACLANTVGAAESVLRVAATGHDGRLFLKVIISELHDIVLRPRFVISICTVRQVATGQFRQKLIVGNRFRPRRIPSTRVRSSPACRPRSRAIVARGSPAPARHRRLRVTVLFLLRGEKDRGDAEQMQPTFLHYLQNLILQVVLTLYLLSTLGRAASGVTIAYAGKVGTVFIFTLQFC